MHVRQSFFSRHLAIENVLRLVDIVTLRMKLRNASPYGDNCVSTDSGIYDRSYCYRTTPLVNLRMIDDSLFLCPSADSGLL